MVEQLGKDKPTLLQHEEMPGGSAAVLRPWHSLEGFVFLYQICFFHSELLVMQEKETVASHCLPLMTYLLHVADWTPKNPNLEKQSTEVLSGTRS